MQKEFTKQAERVLETAKLVAKRMKHPYVGTEHVLYALCKEFMGVAGQVLESSNVDSTKILNLIQELTASLDTAKKGRLEFSPRLEFMLDNALQDAVRLKSERIGTEHLLLAMIKDGDCVATRILNMLNVDLAKIADEILEIIGVNPKEYFEDNNVVLLKNHGITNRPHR